MKCPNCGAEVRKEDTFCGECRFQIRQKVGKKWFWLIYGGIIYFIFWIILILAEEGFSDFNDEDWAIFFIIVIVPSILMISIGYVGSIKSGRVFKPQK